MILFILQALIFVSVIMLIINNFAVIFVFGLPVPKTYDLNIDEYKKLNLFDRNILSGGLNPNNVAMAIKRTQPWAVDVSSGVEASKGIKDEKKIFSFMQGVKQL